ncbi:MAG TPA: hypothetical protein VFV99_26175 [Kofleriaceae bacterium]|nr:hypothetical protein [Kofleriaceae bacterium]
MRRSLEITGWALLALPALYQILLLCSAIGGRVAYPYDLEWMEGGMLHHALRFQTGHGIYSEPSVEFIPYLYTPLYPALLAILGEIFGLTYTLGRVISVLSLVGIAIVGAISICSPRNRNAAMLPAVVGTVLALGLFAAVYPFVEGWYDLVRADALFLFLVTAGLVAAMYWTDQGEGWRGHGRVAAVGAILAFAFFTKQTGIFYVLLGGAIVLILRWRRLAAYIAAAGVVGLGGSGLMNLSSGGWFWTYIRKIHSAHDFNYDRFWVSFGNILWHFRALTIVIIVTLIVVGYTWLRRPAEGSRRELPRQTRPFLLWTSAFVVSTIVGAIGWGTEFAHFNAYMPAFLHGALAAGAAVPALAACAGILWGARQHSQLVVHGAAGLAALLLAVTCLHWTWQPKRFKPTDADVAAGDRLIKRIKALDGEVWMPSHPWYLVLAGKQPHVHRMGVKDVTTRQNRRIVGLDDALEKHRFSSIVFDNRDLFLELPRIRQFYRPALKLPADERPRLFTGAMIVPDSIWVPALEVKPPAGARVVFDFEMTSWSGWTKAGSAWGPGPVTESLPGQDLVIGATGQRFADSMHGGDVATGRLTSPTFPLDGNRLTLQVGGGTDATKLRIELWVEGQIVASSGAPSLGGDVLREVSWDISAQRGKFATLVLVDDATTADGHIVIDDVWIWDR